MKTAVESYLKILLSYNNDTQNEAECVNVLFKQLFKSSQNSPTSCRVQRKMRHCTFKTMACMDMSGSVKDWQESRYFSFFIVKVQQSVMTVC